MRIQSGRRVRPVVSLIGHFWTNSTFHILSASQRNARRSTLGGHREIPNDRYSCRRSDFFRRVSRKRRPCPSPRPQCVWVRGPCGRRLAQRAGCCPRISSARVQQSSRKHVRLRLVCPTISRIWSLHDVAWAGGMMAMPSASHAGLATRVRSDAMKVRHGEIVRSCGPQRMSVPLPVSSPRFSVSFSYSSDWHTPWHLNVDSRRAD